MNRNFGFSPDHKPVYRPPLWMWVVSIAFWCVIGAAIWAVIHA